MHNFIEYQSLSWKYFRCIHAKTHEKLPTYVDCRVALTCNLFKLKYETFILPKWFENEVQMKLSSYTNQRSQCDFE